MHPRSDTGRRTFGRAPSRSCVWRSPLHDGWQAWPASAPQLRHAPWLALALAAWAAVWLLLLAGTSLSPPADNLEQLTWVRSIEWGYYKHPPLPTMLLWPLTRVFGLHPWVADIAGASCIVCALWVGWRLTCGLRGPHVAGLAMLGTLCITYYSGRTNYYNHNTVLLMLVTGAAWCCWRAFEKRSWLAWLGLGLLLGLGALTKYQMALAGASVLCVWWQRRGWIDPLHRRGLAMATGVAAVVVSPHLLWLVEHDFAPMHYALRSSLGAALPLDERLLHSLNWLADQSGRLGPALILGAGLLAWSRRGAARAARARRPVAVEPYAAQAFLFAWGALPLMMIAALGIFAGADLQLQWGTAFVPLTCAWLMGWVSTERWRRVRWCDAVTAFAAVQLLLALLNWLTSPMGPSMTMQQHNRHFPSQAVAEFLGPAARAALQGPITVIAGPSRVAETLAVRLQERPRVLIDGRLDQSPWLVPADLEGHTLLWVGAEADTPPAGSSPQRLPGGLWWTVQPWHTAAAPENLTKTARNARPPCGTRYQNDSDQNSCRLTQ